MTNRWLASGLLLIAAAPPPGARELAACSGQCALQTAVVDVFRNMLQRRIAFRRSPRSPRTNVARLRPVWVYQPPGTGPLEGTPIVARRGDVRHVGSGLGRRAGSQEADDRSGSGAADRRKRAEPGLPTRQSRCRDRSTTRSMSARSTATWSRSTRRLGIERWTVPVGENPTGHAITAAPLAVDDKVIVGISGGEAGIRGFLDAYDAKTRQAGLALLDGAVARANRAARRGRATVGCTAAGRPG